MHFLAGNFVNHLLSMCYRVLPKQTLVFDLTVLESYEELDAVLRRALGAPLPGSEISRDISENINFSVRERADALKKRGLEKVVFRVFFSSP